MDEMAGVYALVAGVLSLGVAFGFSYAMGQFSAPLTGDPGDDEAADLGADPYAAADGVDATQDQPFAAVQALSLIHI